MKKPIKPYNEMSDAEKVKFLEDKMEYLEIENEYLKKLDALIREKEAKKIPKKK